MLFWRRVKSVRLGKTYSKSTNFPEDTFTTVLPQVLACTSAADLKAEIEKLRDGGELGRLSQAA